MEKNVNNELAALKEKNNSGELITDLLHRDIESLSKDVMQIKTEIQHIKTDIEKKPEIINPYIKTSIDETHETKDQLEEVEILNDYKSLGRNNGFHYSAALSFLLYCASFYLGISGIITLAIPFFGSGCIFAAAAIAISGGDKINFKDFLEFIKFIKFTKGDKDDI